MGVRGLWELLAPAGQRVGIETLSGRRVAVDASIWLNQFVRAVRDTEAMTTVRNAHLLGIFRRCCKLLYYGIEAVFVFDGGVPSLKRRTRERRRHIQNRHRARLRRAAERLLLAQLHLTRTAGQKEQASASLAPADALETALQSDTAREKHPTMPRRTSAKRLTGDETRVPSDGNQPEVQRSHYANTNGRQRDELDFMAGDSTEFGLPCATSEEIISDDGSNCEAFELPDLENIDADAVVALPASVQKEIIASIRRRMHTELVETVENLDELRSPSDFSQLQVDRFLRTSQLRSKLRDARQRASHGTHLGRRLASDATREYVLVENERNLDTARNRDLAADARGTERPGACVRASVPDAPSRSAAVQSMTVNAISGTEWASEISSGFRFALETPHDARDGDAAADCRHRVRHAELSASDVVGMPQDTRRTMFTTSNEAPSSDDRLEPARADEQSDAEFLENIEWNEVSTEGSDQEAQFASAEELTDRRLSSEHNLQKRTAQAKHLSHATLDRSGAESNAEAPMNKLSSVAKYTEMVSTEHADSLTRPAIEPRETADTPSIDIGSAANDAVGPAAFEATQPARESSNVRAVPLLADEQIDCRRPVAANTWNSAAPADAATYHEPGRNSISQELPPGSDAGISPDDRSEDSRQEASVDACGTLDGGIAARTHHECDHSEWRSQQRAKFGAARGLIPAHRSFPMDTTEAANNAAGTGEHRGALAMNARADDATERQRMEPMFAEHEEMDLAKLRSEYAAAVRHADSVTEQMFADTKRLLQLLGIPYIEAAMEAEAQCAFLSRAGIVDAVVTEDSDAFLFGASRVYRHIFEDSKYVEEYEMDRIERNMGLSRDKLICLGLLLGSDYSDGVYGVGIVNATEIVEAFCRDPDPACPDTSPEREPFRGLQDFREWLDAVHLGDDPASVSDPEPRRAAFKKLHINMKRNWNLLDKTFPNRHVIEAFLRPQVDTSWLHRRRELFPNCGPDPVALRAFCHDLFGWDSAKLEQALGPVVQAFQRHRERQTRIDSFFQPHRFARIRSTRLQNAVRKLACDGLSAGASQVSGAEKQPPDANGDRDDDSLALSLLAETEELMLRTTSECMDGTGTSFGSGSKTKRRRMSARS